MRVIPSSALEILEFHKVLALVGERCTGEVARQKCSGIVPREDARWIREELMIAGDAMRIHEEQLTVITGAYPRLEDVLDQLRVDGLVVPGEELIDLLAVLLQVRDVLTFFNSEHGERFPHLAGLSSGLPDPADAINAMTAVLDEEGQVRPDASDTLRSLAKSLAARRRQGDQLFEKVIRKYADQGWLSDTLESMRNGRRVLAVISERKRQIRGIIHDQSATGKTAFVEPEELIEVNNDVIEIQGAIRAEERRILLELCDQLRPSVPYFAVAEDVLSEIDLYLAKGRLGMALKGACPEISDQPVLHIEQGRHPLLFLKNREGGKTTVPFDLHLQKGNRILLLSGPNAGGKSILMKSVGLMQVMVQSGLPIPADARSEFGVFEKLCVELGDRQSIENDLSTYSSRLQDMKEFVAAATDRTLVLIDEFGSGTDPKLGGAIAEAILDALIKRGVHGVLTTHYSELKVYAFRKKGVVNGAMVFDQESMAPSYQLRVGVPGSSFAFEIAERTGLPKEVLGYARKRAGKQTRALEDLLIDLERQKHALSEKLKAVREQERNLDKLVRNYERLQQDLTAQRKKFRLEQKERDYQHISQLNRELEKSVRAIRESHNLEAAQKELHRIKEAREEVRQEIGEINAALAQERSAKVTWRVGDFVKVQNGLHTGQIERLEKNQATVIIGQLRMNVPVTDLTPAGDPLEINPRASVQHDLARQPVGQFNPLLDIRGLRADEAGELLEKFLDGALMSNTSPVRIIHGKGTGALRRLVVDKLKEYPAVETRHPEDQAGGSGTTIVEF